MRFPNADENLVGKVCCCSIGRAFIVTGKATLPYGESWVGLGLDGKGTASSRNPFILAESGQEFHDTLMTRFNGKMGYNG